jgi:hypothetical protein
MKITIIAPNGLKITAEMERWLCGLVALLDERQTQKLCELVAKRIEIGHVAGQIISVPSITSKEEFGKLGGG